ncbi:MAG: hypothetical protein ABIW79_03765 [Gemmatimonas sp.]
MLLTCAIATGAAIPVEAQTPESRSVRSGSSSKPAAPPITTLDMRVLSSLDVWIVERFRGAQLLPDSVAARAARDGGGALPRIESARGGGSVDTLFALHFTPRATEGALASRQTVRLAGPTGTIAPLTGTVVARRAFRAPRVPGANVHVASGDSATDASWRYGWAYIVSLPNAGRGTPAATFRGWLLLDGSAPK